MAAPKALDALTAEREAAQAEGIFEPTDEQKTRLRRYRGLSKRADEIKAEMDAIKASIVAEMEEVGAKALAVNGKNWVLIGTAAQPVVDKEAMEMSNPEIVAAYTALLARFTTRKQNQRVTVKPA